MCLQESKIASFSVSLNIDLTSCDFDYAVIPALGAVGGTVTSWRRDLWNIHASYVRRFSVTVKLSSPRMPSEPWFLTNVYGPPIRADKPAFLQELRDVAASCPGPWLVCGDFNLIYQAADKSNGRLHRSLMRAFRRALDDSHLQELALHGRRFTWTNGRDNPTLERIDRVFANADWFLRFPHHHLKSLALDSSDHAPLLLILNVEPWAVPRFHFELCWAKLDGFLEAVGVAWGQPSPLLDACTSASTAG